MQWGREVGGGEEGVNTVMIPVSNLVLVCNLNMPRVFMLSSLGM